MIIDVITIFPELLGSFLDCSIVGRARKNGLLTISTHNLRDWTADRHRTVDDIPFGGGPGMVMRPEPWFAALRDLTQNGEAGTSREIILFSPRGERLTQRIIEKLSTTDHLLLLCGRYEEVDDRVRQRWATMELSLGDYIITGGELAAQVVIEGVTRLLPGAIGDPESARQDSFSRGLLDHRHFTRPQEYEGMAVPPVLTSGNHELIRRWRLRDSLEITWRRRPDLLESLELTDEEQQILREIKEKEDQRA